MVRRQKLYFLSMVSSSFGITGYTLSSPFKPWPTLTHAAFLFITPEGRLTALFWMESRDPRNRDTSQ